MSDLAWLIVAVLAFVAGIFVGRGLGGISFTLSSGTPGAEQLMQTVIDTPGPPDLAGLGGTAVDSSPLLRTIPVGRVLTADDLDIEVRSLALRQAGSVLEVNVRDRDPRDGQAIGGILALTIPETPILHVSDDAGTVYSVQSTLGGGPGSLEGRITFTPPPPPTARQLTVAVVATTADPQAAWRAAQGTAQPPANAPRLEILL